MKSKCTPSIDYHCSRYRTAIGPMGIGYLNGRVYLALPMGEDSCLMPAEWEFASQQLGSLSFLFVFSSQLGFLNFALYSTAHFQNSAIDKLILLHEDFLTRKSIFCLFLKFG